MKNMIDVMTGNVFLVDELQPVDTGVPSDESLNTLSNQTTTLRTDLDDLGNQVQAIQGDVNTLKLQSPVKKDTILDKSLTVNGEEEGAMFQVSFIGKTAQVATNNGMDFISPSNFLVTPTVENPSDYNIMLPNAVVTKSQVVGAISSVTGAHFDKWVLMGKPNSVTLTTSLKKIPFPTNTRFPSLAPESMELNSTGNGIIFKKAGLVHVKRNVSLGGANTQNIYYEARINDQTLEPLQSQAVSVSENTMSYSIEFYWQVTANQEFSIWGNCLSGTAPLNYKGVCMMMEYL